MLIELKSMELTNEETVKLIKRELFTARNANNKSLLKPLQKKLTRKLKILSGIASGLTETADCNNVFVEEFKDEDNIAFALYHNLCIKSIWDIMMSTLTELITSTGTISLDIEELKQLNWIDTRKLVKTFGDVIIVD